MICPTGPMGMDVSTLAGWPICSSTSCTARLLMTVGEHPHLVGAGTLHVAAPVLGAAPEVAAADDQAHLDPLGHAGLDDLAYLPDEGKVDAPARLARPGPLH